MAPSLVFFGSSPFSIIVLQKLLDRPSTNFYQLTAVVTTPDRPAGRHLQLTPNPVKVLAQKHGLPVHETMNDLMTMNDNRMPIGLVAAYGKIIPPQVIRKFAEIYNIHPSLLPKYRGPSPLQQQILDGTAGTGVTIIQLDEQMDHGPIVAVARDTVRPSDTWITLGNRLFALGAELFIENLQNIEHWTLNTQDHSQATYTKKLTRQDGFVPWDQFNHQLSTDDSELSKKLRAFSTWPGVWTTQPDGRRLKLVSLHPPLIQLEGQKPAPPAAIRETL